MTFFNPTAILAPNSRTTAAFFHPDQEPFDTSIRER